MQRRVDGRGRGLRLKVQWGYSPTIASSAGVLGPSPALRVKPLQPEQLALIER